MAGIKTYQIKIDGIQESIDAVKSLEKELFNLEQRIKTLEAKSVNIKTGSSGGGGSSRTSNASSLSEEEKLEKQILQTEAKREAYSKEIYQNYLAAKELLDETVKDQKQLAAAERLSAGAYSNTMQGMKQELADIKAVMQTVDLGDTGKFDELTKRANELNTALLEIEKSYGQFGRNVGNYKSAVEGFAVAIGDTVAHFDNAKQALKELKKERDTLSTKKDLGLISEEEAQRLKNLIPVVAQLKSSIEDAGKPMDALMDSMQSVVAIAQSSKGLSAFFGFDNEDIQKSIQKLVGLQNTMQGIQTIQKQMQSQEGIGKLFSTGSDKIDELVAGITNAKIETEGLTKASRLGTMAVRGLSMVLKGLGIGLVVAAISLAVKEIEKLVNSLNIAKIKESALESEANALNKQYQLRKDLLAGSYMSNAISNEEFLKEQYKIENEYIESQIRLLKDRADLLNARNWLDAEKDVWSSSGEYNTGFTGKRLKEPTTVGSWNLIGQFSYDVKSVKEAEEAWKKLNNAVKQGKDYFEEYGEGISGWFDSLKVSVQETEDVMHGMGNISLSDTIGTFEELNTKFKDGKISAEDFAKGLKQLVDKMNSSEVLQSVIANLDKYIPDEKVREKVENILTYIGRLNDEFNAVSEAQIHHWNQVRIDAMEQGAAKIAAQMAEDERHEIAQYGHTQEQISLIQQKYQRKRLDETKKNNKKLKSEADKRNKEQLEAEKDLVNLRISNMKEGLNKVLKQLEEERKLRLKKVEADGILVAERQAEINAQYDKKVIEATKKAAEERRKVYQEMWDSILEYSINTQSKLNGTIETALGTYRGILERGRSNERPAYISSYGVQGASRLSDETKKELQIEEEKSKDLFFIYMDRRAYAEEYWNDLIEMEKSAISTLYEAEISLENQEFEKRKSDNEKHYNELLQQQSDYIDKRKEEIKGLANQEKWTQKELDLELLNADKEYQEAATTLYTKYKEAETALVSEHETNLIKIRENTIKKTQNINGEYYRDTLQELRDFHTAISNLESKQPVINEWGITDFKKTNENNRLLLQSYKVMSDDIIQLKRELQQKLDDEQITFDDFQSATRELDAFQEDLGEKMDKVKKDLSVGEQIGQFISDIQQYIQVLGQGLQTIMNSLWDAQDTQFDNEARQLDKLNEKLQDAMDKNEEILERHKQNVDSIEDELQTARGARREHLIDQLNAEVIAERRAAAEKKKIEKEQEALKKKQDELDKKRQEAQYQRELTQILVSGALATINAYATKPFVPVGLAMGSLSLGIVAAQYAIAKANPPKFKEGGVIQGKSHAQGGVKVLGGYAEVEGGEMITNKVTTQKNIDVLEYINTKKRRLNLDDFIEFYTSDKPRTVIKNMSPKSRFENGGVVPTLRTDIDVSGSLTDAFKEYARTPSIVQVVDIVDKTKKYNDVRVMAGLE